MKAKTIEMLSVAEETGNVILVTAMKKMEGIKVDSVGEHGVIFYSTNPGEDTPTDEEVARRNRIFEKNAGSLQDQSKELLEYLNDIDGDLGEE